MNGKVKFRIGDIVYHKTLNLGAGKVRFIYRTEVLVDFTNAVPARYAKEALSKIRSCRSDLRSDEPTLAPGLVIA